MKDSVKVFAPASVSNVGCGFDTMGFALENPGDEIVLTKNNSGKIKITEIVSEKPIPTDINKNTATVGMLAMLRELDEKIGVDVKIIKKMALGSGLGSSACSAVAGVVALNEFTGNKFSKKELLPFALEGERIASKAIHADNVAPCLLGGFILIRGYNPPDIVSLPVPDNLYCSVIHPQVVVKTSEARDMLPESIEIKRAIKQWGNVGGLVAGLCLSDYELIGRSIADEVAEPIRQKLIPGYSDIKNAALDAGALGCNISGSGPSVFTLCEGKEIAEQVAFEMTKIACKHNLQSSTYVSSINNRGAEVIG